MPAYTHYTFQNDTGDKTKVIDANKFNSNANHYLAAMPPIGSILPFYDFNAALTFNLSYWAFCNGQTKVISGIGSQVLPDLSNRYLVGFGTEGGGDNGSAAWSTTPTGVANHSITIGSANLPTHTHDIAHGHANSFAVSAVALGGTTSFASTGHTHTMSSHTHSLSAHTHTTDIGSFTSGAGSSHSHGPGTLKWIVGFYDEDGSGNGRTGFYNTTGQAITTGMLKTDNNGVNEGTGTGVMFTGKGQTTTYFYTAGQGAGTTDNEVSHTHSIDPGSTASDGPSNDTSGTNNDATAGPSATGTVSVSGGVLSGAVTALGTTASGNGGFANTAISVQPRSVLVRWLMRIL